MKRLAVVALAFMLSGCATPALFKFPDSPKNVPQPQYNKLERKVIEPVVGFVTIDGKQVPVQIGYRENYQYDIHATPAPDKPQSFWSWILNPFQSWWVWLIVGFIVFVPGGWAIFQWAAGRIRKRMGQVVYGVEQFLNSDAPADAKEKLLTALSRNMDARAKREVSDLKLKK